MPFTPVEDQHIDKQTNRYAAAFGLSYDVAGNVTADSKFRGLKYEYDANGRQWWSAPLSNPTNAAVAVYDGVGQRVQMSADDVTTIMVYDIFGQLIAEYGGQSSDGAGGVQYLMSDVQGSTRAVLNNDGVVTARHDYQAFGAEIGAGTGKRTGGQRYSVTDSTRQRYAGMEQEGELSHTWFRKYENQSGRWTTPDPYNGSMRIGDPQSFNRYPYVQNDPVNFVDPTGLERKICGHFDDGSPVYCDEIEHVYTRERGYSSFADWLFVLNSFFGGYTPQKSGFKDWEQKGVDEALKAATDLTDSTKGKNQKKCDEALKVLSNGKISSLHSLVSQYISSGTGSNIVNGRKVSAGSYGVDSPDVPAFVLGTGTSNAKTYLNSKFFNFTAFAGTARAIVLLHEAVHNFGGLRDIDFDPNTKKKDQSTGSHNITNAIIDSCSPGLRQFFKELKL